LSICSCSHSTLQTWHLNPLPAHPNGIIFTVFNADGDMLATNEYYSVGGGFVVNKETQINENLYYMDVKSSNAGARRSQSHHNVKEKTVDTVPAIGDGSAMDEPLEVVEKPGDASVDCAHATRARPPYLFATAEELFDICEKHNLTIAQVVWENERTFRSDEEIEEGLLHRE
jgi:hypothetical protein